MIIYSVTISIEQAVQRDWLSWMQVRHIPDVMDTGYFLRYEMRRLLDPAPEAGHETYNIQYHCRSLVDLDEYLDKEAARLQEDHHLRYQGRYAAIRTILESV